MFNTVDKIKAVIDQEDLKTAQHRLQLENENLKRKLQGTTPSYSFKYHQAQKEIAEYKLTIKNDIEVIYKLVIHRNILEVASKTFLSKVDEKTKQLFLDTIKEVKEKRDNDQNYKERWWKWVNKNYSVSGSLLWEIKNQAELDYTPYMIFPDMSEPL